MKDGIWLQIAPANGGTVAYVRGDVIKLNTPGPSPAAEANAQELLTAIVDNDKKTYTNLLDAYKLYKDLKTKKIVIPQTLEKKFVDIYDSLSERQAKIKTLDGVKCTTGRAKDTATSESLTAWVYSAQSIRGIGFVQLVVIIVAALIIGAGTAAAVYYATRPDYEDSKADLKESELLKKALSTLTPDQQTLVRTDLNKQIDDAYNAGKKQQKLTDFFKSTVGKIIVAGAVFLGASYFLQQKKGGQYASK